MTEEERIASEDLNLSGFYFRWKAAKDLALDNERGDDYRLLPYWERVRLLYFELGGRRRDGSCC